MKTAKIAIILVIIQTCSTSAYCAGIEAIGLKTGLNIAYVSNWSDKKPRFCFTAGGYLNYKFLEYLSLQPELSYSQKGYKQDRKMYSEIGTDLGKGTYIQKYDYLDFFIPYSITIDLSINSSLIIIFGPGTSFLIKASGEIDSPDDDYDQVYNFNINRFNRFKICIVNGLGFKFKNRAWLEISYIKEIGHYERSHELNKVLSFTLGYSFYTKKTTLHF